MEDSLLARAPLFDGLTAQEQAEAVRRLGSRRVRCPRGTFLWRQGEVPAGVGLVLQGSFHLVREDVWGRRRILETLSPGDCFGEAYACLPGTPLEVGVFAAAEAEALLLRLSPQAGAGAAWQARLMQNLARVLAAKNLILTRKIQYLSQRSLREKLLAYLSAQAMGAASPEFDIPFGRQQLADYLCCDRSALCRQLSLLKKEGLIRFRKNRFQLLADARPEDF